MNSKAEPAMPPVVVERVDTFTEGSIGKAIWQMSWPLLLTSTLSSMIGLVDMYLAGFMGEAAQAAIGIGEQFIFLAVTIGTGLCVGCQALVSRCAGAREWKLAWLYIKDSIYACAFLGLMATVVGVFFAKEIFSIFAAEAAVNNLGVRYLQLTSLGNLPFMVAMTLTAIFRAAGAPRYALYVWSIITIVSIGSAFAFVFGNMPWGAMAVDSLAWSWNLGSTIGAVFGLTLLIRLHCPQVGQLGRSDLLPDFARVKEVLAVGIPATVADLCWVISNFVLFLIFANLAHGTAAQAAWSVALKIEETVASYPLVALSLAVSAVVGQNLGAGNATRAFRATSLMALYSGIAMLFVGGVLTLGSGYLVSLFSSDALVIQYGTMLLSLSPLVLPLMALWLIFFGALEGAGITSVPMIYNIAAYLLIRLPLAWALALPAGLGFKGVFIALIVSRAMLCAVAGLVFARKRWLKTGLKLS